MSLFGNRSAAATAHPGNARVPRYSSGWMHLLKYLKANESLRVLDIGPTSSTNINYVTGLGHSIYMANLVEEADRPEWMRTGEDDVQVFAVEEFLAANVTFSGRRFDVVMLWDTADYLPPSVVAPLAARLYEVMDPGGQVLAFFHAKAGEGEAMLTRYHLTDGDQLELQRVTPHALVQMHSTRQIETLFQCFAGHRFFLAKDALREVIITR